MTAWIRRHTRWLVAAGAAGNLAAAITQPYTRVPIEITIVACVVAAAAMITTFAPLFVEALHRNPIPAMVGGPAIALVAVAVRWQVEHPVAVTACTVATALGALGPLVVLLTSDSDEQEGDQ